PSTTDYNGLYKGRYIDFEAKETKSRTSFPLANVHEHQIQHLKQVIAHEGIGFILIRFSTFDETYYLDANRLMQYWDKMLAGGRKSISYKDLQATGILIPFHYQKRVDYLNIVNQLYF
ncbi:MAG TPA: Holliday junction resolvase RecU, partial [Candidatus Avamphibacillus intestinigallinarum]|nr:Holliday junction resolvase RecU [Candidatus Avamphibacillus intestinigallinarum]